jgi:hypothetical protein
MNLVNPYLYGNNVPPMLRTKPTYPSMLDNDPINDGMTVCCVMNEGQYDGLADLCRPGAGFAAADHPTWDYDDGIAPGNEIINFNGTSNYLSSVPEGAAFTGDFSIFFRLYIDYTGYGSFNGNTLFPQIAACNHSNGQGLDGWNFYYIRPNEVSEYSGKLGFIFKTQDNYWGQDFVSSNTTFNINQWVNVGVVRSGITSQIYLGGSVNGQGITSDQAIYYGDGFSGYVDPVLEIGNKVASTDYCKWRGPMAIARMWQRGLSFQEMQQLNTNPYRGIVNSI